MPPYPAGIRQPAERYVGTPAGPDRRRVGVVVAAVLAAACLLSACTAGSLAGSHLRQTGGPTPPGAPVASHRPGAGSVLPPARGPLPAGRSAWRLTRPAAALSTWQAQIEGYDDPDAGLPGATVRLMVSTTARRYRVEAYRVGGYPLAEARLVWTSPLLAGHRQRPPRLLPATRTVVATWPASVSVRTAGWAPGFYLFKLLASTGYQSYVPYTVRSPSTAGRVVLVAPVMDWQAYNDWGGYDVYQAPPGRYRSYAVSFDRPYPAGVESGARLFMDDVSPVVVLAERRHVPLAYETDVDVAVHPDLLRGAAGYVTLGHDEYWTVSERRYVTAARDRGTNIAFLSSNTMYWRVRLQDAPSGPDRVVVAYKSDAATADPMRNRDPAETTARWRDRPHPDPENSLTGTLYECYPVEVPYRVVSPSWWGFRGTGVRAGSQFPDLVGDEADRVYPIRSTPRPLEILSYTPYSCLGAPTSSESTYYTTSSGAGVIDFGTQRWACATGLRCHRLPPQDDRFVRRVTTNVLRAFARGPVGLRYPAVDNVADFPLAKVNQVPAS